ncbi:Nitroreductase family protein [Posidoniimonas polymericola]|uniref:Nitroreductase family protein n=1 Tax=Posidoniimonas polymericola TaxID=2528002 RepID=A0A5C5YSE9_9BACT|nr:nitroreductase family protein [Posidoniimonas polymericola]TWT77912.1 Nitroreductase family protein [Posidoniimonas polymericola]
MAYRTNMMNNNAPAIVADVIRRRRTEKVLCEVDDHQPVPPEVAAAHKPTVLAAIETAGWAPFHFPRQQQGPRQQDGLAEPWRAHVVWPKDLRPLALFLRDELKLTSKEPSLVAGASALVLVTWLPEFHDPRAAERSGLDPEQQRIRDEEHLAAASAMVQNLLLLLTAHGMGTYWSSGGKLRGAEAFEYLGIPAGERLLAAVFVEYLEMMSDSKQRKPGALRDKRGSAWIREVKLA